jgi:hypothetical protein
MYSDEILANRCDMQTSTIRGIASAQRVTREVLLEIAEKLRPGDTEREVVRRIESRLHGAGVRVWLHTPYAWWGERTRFSGFSDWQPDALATERRLLSGDAFILDAAPFVEGYPADYAFCGVCDPDPAAKERERAMRDDLTEIKAKLVLWARTATTGRGLYETVGEAIVRAGYEAIHPAYPASVLGHALDVLPRILQKTPRIGDGFQLPLVAGYAFAFLRHKLAGASYPLVNPSSTQAPKGIFAFEPHLGTPEIGMKFESILLIDGDETRWLDPGLFGEVVG